MPVDSSSPAGRYRLGVLGTTSFEERRKAFFEGTDSPRRYLERCIERIETIDGPIMAWAFKNYDAARKAADESDLRYKDHRPLSLVDGMPLGIKDLYETADMPTEYGSDLFRGNRPIRDAAAVYFLRHGGATLLGKTVTIKLKKYNWSDGKPLTSEDILFFMQMLKAEKSIWPVYVPGEFPDNVAMIRDAAKGNRSVLHSFAVYLNNSDWQGDCLLMHVSELLSGAETGTVPSPLNEVTTSVVSDERWLLIASPAEGFALLAGR